MARTEQKWGCRMKIAVYDNGGETVDRYTFVPLSAKHYPPYWTRHGYMYTALACDETPTHPMGFSQFTECQRGRHLGKRIPLASLPPALRAHVVARLAP